ncbi:hypothetical protein BCR43DRAFT_113616 [Syncephalastrum racemosum]|uniref:Uncharacterized protein n=1 Tax=Syncephalastrum racemosum TaxID=13706 RepID=A0A1X2H075_SYNRA|nr:hypothetical protein BCR43DRAFT_113616 [Syncephalastrum racemosum]
MSWSCLASKTITAVTGREASQSVNRSFRNIWSRQPISTYRNPCTMDKLCHQAWYSSSCLDEPGDLKILDHWCRQRDVQLSKDSLLPGASSKALRHMRATQFWRKLETDSVDYVSNFKSTTGRLLAKTLELKERAIDAALVEAAQSSTTTTTTSHPASPLDRSVSPSSDADSQLTNLENRVKESMTAFPREAEKNPKQKQVIFSHKVIGS